MLDHKRRMHLVQEDLDAMDEAFAKMKAQFLQDVIDGKITATADFMKRIQHLERKTDAQYDYDIGTEEEWGNQE